MSDTGTASISGPMRIDWLGEARTSQLSMDADAHPSRAAQAISCLTPNVAVCGSRRVEFYCITFTHSKVMVDLLFLSVKFGQLTLVLHANTLHLDREIGGAPYGA